MAQERANAPLSSALLKCFGQDGDCTVIVKSESSAEGGPQHEKTEFRVWSKLLCAWSDVFAAMFAHDFKEQASGIVEIVDFSPAAVEAFLRFLYSGRLDVGLLPEVWALADKYAVAALREVCDEQVADALAPRNACEIYAAAVRHGAVTLKERCMVCISEHAPEALKSGFVMGQALLDAVLSTKTLCIDDFALAMVLLDWVENPSVTAHKIDVGAILQRHVQALAMDDSQWSQVQSRADAVGLGGVVKELRSSQKRGAKTDNYLNSLRKMYESRLPSSCRPPFLGYWVNIIPSQASFGNENSDPGLTLTFFQQLAGGGRSRSLNVNEELVWMTPHHGIFASTVKFTKQKGSHVEVFCSCDGVAWHMLAESRQDRDPTTEAIPCSSKGCAKWFKLRVRKGSCNTDLRVGGIIMEE
mmetsp:Transcript_12258/g.38715  ORF Transcript_12258/g.38715 Transcript_12258/m.38715 type:complete len:414 (+) Transcript_12258:91-1332(+)|eukprot:CAMPEP_0204563158 /NCGR_PEP_ID=MMETSP0661-20131031/34154_1 /ASSEMBLY_ACC=CAM_ASM_000606 /TAXON_ID=109239 /ORGANISM="Alexandrium margalefi, Strain AMGDE01CS-322" /LENGTH=413 /DNA_ID=CAMNT_0051570695 /DNA_START=72 /DNA_END=1313 /DNA_ORIENTATION=+